VLHKDRRTNRTSFAKTLTPRGVAQLAGTLELLSEKPNPYDPPIASVAFSRDGTKIVAGFQDRTFKAWKVFTWSRQDHSRFNATTQRIVLWVLWLNKHHMKFPDDVLDLLIEACLRSR
jgi:hypothetical protein